MDLGMSNSKVSQARMCWERPGSGIENYNINNDENVVITNVPIMNVPPTRAGYIKDNPPISDLDYLPDNCVFKQTDTGSLIFGPGSYLDIPHLSSASFKHEREVNSAVLGNVTNSYPP